MKFPRATLKLGGMKPRQSHDYGQNNEYSDSERSLLSEIKQLLLISKLR